MDTYEVLDAVLYRLVGEKKFIDDDEIRLLHHICIMVVDVSLDVPIRLEEVVVH